MSIVRRILDPSEVSRAIAAGGPLQELVTDPSKLQEMSIAVVEVDGEITAYWVAWYGLHVEPLWVKPEWRQHPGVIRGIVQEMEALILRSGEPAAFCMVQEEDLSSVAAYAHRLGFAEAPGRLYYVVVQEPATEPVEV